ncbi:hypothetical protein THOM_0742 [Trachipleistophora hominis]|uniref:Uncharacterized protein n=1 Tax=Trachipleistophora hominis TaxID=72359 RepID=L7JZX2_TRAHO|nr:hypothetical protein THOM_0742 [Trachipleistophora hominis]
MLQLVILVYVLSIVTYNYEHTYTNILPLTHLHLTRNPILIRRITPQIVMSSYNQDENSLDEESEVQNDAKDKGGFMKKMKKMLSEFVEGVTIGKMLFFGFVVVICVLIGYQIRKREEQSNYVRLPNAE